MIYLLTAIGLSPGGSTHLHKNNTQENTNNKRTTQITTNVEECRPCPVFASSTLAFALQLRKKHGKTTVRIRKNLIISITEINTCICCKCWKVSYCNASPNTLSLAKTKIKKLAVYKASCEMKNTKKFWAGNLNLRIQWDNTVVNGWRVLNGY
jgi:hypothetical protein